MKCVNVKAYGGIEAARRAGVIYCGRPTILGNHYTHLDGIPNTVKVASREEAIERFRVWLWDRIKKRDGAVLDFLEQMNENSLLGCHCNPKPCHVQVIIRAWYWLKQNGYFRPVKE